MFSVTRTWVEATMRSLGIRVITVLQEGNKTVVRYEASNGEDKTIEITPHINEALTVENLKRKL